MCQYSCDPEAAPGVPNDWHLMHLGSFAAGGAALILTEAAAVNAAGRISPRDAGLYNDEQAAGWERIVGFVHRHGVADAKIGAQLAHAGRKASTYWPFSGEKGSVPASDGGWETVGPGSGAFDGYAAPAAMTEEDIQERHRRFRRCGHEGRRRRVRHRLKSMARTATCCTSSKARS